MTETYMIAGVCAEITHTYPAFARRAREYVCEGEQPRIRVTVTGQDVELERRLASIPDCRDDYLECLAVYRKLCDALAAEGVLLFHSSAVSVDGRGYLFAAPSGTGKSTHTALWRSVFGQRAVMVNDDKPLLRPVEGGALVYGTPFNGKHGLGSNVCVPVAGVCFLRRGEHNEIRRAEPGEKFSLLLSQTYRPLDPAAFTRVIGLVARLAQSLPVFEMKCNMDPEAAKVAYEAMKGETGNET